MILTSFLFKRLLLSCLLIICFRISLITSSQLDERFLQHHGSLKKLTSEKLSFFWTLMLGKYFLNNSLKRSLFDVFLFMNLNWDFFWESFQVEIVVFSESFLGFLSLLNNGFQLYAFFWICEHCGNDNKLIN